jgi:L-arabinose isomerase
MLKREDVQYRSVAGPADDPAVFEEIRTLACAMAVRRRLRAARIGVLPFSCDLMSATWVDEFALRARYGVQLRPLELERVRRVAAEFLDSAVAGFRDALAREGARVEVDERNLSEGIRYALALERVAREEGLSALAMNDVITEMHASFGLRPALSSPGLSDAGIVVSMEADVGAAAAMLALRLYTGEPPFYTEPFSADYAANAVLMGHAGMHDGRLAEPGFPVRIVNDVEYENSDRFTGAATLFKRRSGPVTMVNSVWDGARLCWTLIEGESVAGPPKMDGNCHMLFAPDLPVKEFFRAAMESGVSQHWIAVDGRRAAELSRLCEILDFGCMTVPRPG